MTEPRTSLIATTTSTEPGLAGEVDHSGSDLLNYTAKREHFYRRFASLWPGTLLDPYDVLEVYPLPASEILAITRAAAAIGQIHRRALTLLRTVSDETLLQIGLSPEMLSCSRLHLDGMPDCVIGRLDLVKTPAGYKLLEFNADCSGLLIETFPLNAKVCEVAGRVDPNQRGPQALAAALEKAVVAGLQYVGKSEHEPGNVVFACHSACQRDKDIIFYLMSLPALRRGIRKQYVSFDLLRADENGLYDPEGNQIDVLFRFYQLQLFCGGVWPDRSDESVVHDGTVLFSLVAQRKLALINPPAAFLLGNKALQCVVWGLYEQGLYFDREERALIQQYFLPTYMDPAPGERYVAKPVLGSEGDSITIMDPDKGILFQTSTSTYSDQPMVYQKYVELPQVQLMTEDGSQSLRLLTSCFLVDDQAIGVCLRAGKNITDFSWWYVPVCVENQ